MSKLKRNKIPISIINEDDLIKIGVEQGVIESEFNWKLVREYDGLTKQSKEVMWIEWNKDGTFKKKHDTFGVGFSLIMSPFNQFFTWQTTPLIDVVTCFAIDNEVTIDVVVAGTPPPAASAGM